MKLELLHEDKAGELNKKYIVVLPVSNVKCPKMGELWDDKAIGVVKNTGEVVGE